MLERIAPPAGPNATGAYSPGIRVGNLIFVSGQGPFDPSSGKIAADGIGAQVRRTLENVELVLQAGGSRLDEVVRVDAYLADLEDFPRYDETFREVFGEHLPTRTTVQARLGGILVEINAIAYVDDAS